MNRRKMREMLYVTAFSIVLSGTAFPSHRDEGVSLLTYDTTEGILGHEIDFKNEISEIDVSDISLSAAGTNLGDNTYFAVDDSYADEFPDVSIDVGDWFYNTDRGYMPGSNDTDCVVVNGYSYDYLCDRPGWERAVPLEMFPGRLEYLGLNDTGLAYYPSASFANKTILFLEINNHLESFSLDPNAFQGLIGTQVLHIQGNLWGDLTESLFTPFFGMFAPLGELTQLKLEFNALGFTGIDFIASKDGPTVMPKLEYLSLKGNLVGRIEDYLFHPLRESPITELNLNTAGISSIGEHAFEHLPHLRHVDLYNNPKLVTNYEELHITTIPDLTAALMPLLNQSFTNLGLGSMDLTSIPHRTLDSVADDLVRLNMAKNNITNLGNKANSDPDRWSFPNMASLETLVLADSGIEEIDGHPFANLTNLKYLDVSGNKMHKIFEGLLEPSLVWLDVSSQCQGVEQFVEICLDEFTIEWYSFQYMTNLRSLNMGNVLLQSVQSEYFTGLVNLEILHLDHTDLRRIQSGAFDDMRKLKELYLNHNEDLTGLSQATFEALTNLEILDLAYSSKAFTKYVVQPVVLEEQSNDISLQRQQRKPPLPQQLQLQQQQLRQQQQHQR